MTMTTNSKACEESAGRVEDFAIKIIEKCEVRLTILEANLFLYFFGKH